MIKEVRNRFLTAVILFSVYFLGGIGVLAYGYIVTGGSNLIVTIIFVYFLVSIFVTSYMSNRISYLLNLSFSVRIQENRAEPLPVKRSMDTQRLYQYLESNGFKKYTNDSSHYLFYRVKIDNIKRMFSLYMLEVVVYINKEETEFYLDQVNDEINDLKNKLLSEKKKVNRLFVTQIKEIDELDQKTKDNIAENVFLRTRYNIVSTINIGVYNKELAVLLYSDTYSPSLYYTYHIEQIKNLV